MDAQSCRYHQRLSIRRRNTEFRRRSPAAARSEQRAEYRAELRRRIFGGADIEQHLRLLRTVRNPRVGDRLDAELPQYPIDALPQRGCPAGSSLTIWTCYLLINPDRRQFARTGGNRMLSYRSNVVR